jgi:hypothetical protein
MRIFLRPLFAASLLLLPSLATAQRSRGTEAVKKTDLFDKGADRPVGPTLRSGDVEDLNPVDLLVDKRKDLKLTDVQISQLKDSASTLRERTAPLLREVDSLVRVLKSGAASQSADDRVRTRDARQAINGVLTEIRTAYDSAAGSTRTLLDPDQQTKANELIGKRREKAEKAIREKLNPTPRGSASGRPPRL